MIKECTWCQSAFDANNAGKKYCSQSCRQSAYLKRNGMNMLHGNDTENTANKVELFAVTDTKPKEKLLAPVWKNARIIQLIEDNLTSKYTAYWCKESLEHMDAIEKSALMWIGVRLKCLFHNMLLFSYKEKVNASSVSSLLHGFQEIESSFSFRSLPAGFPFWEQMNDLKTQLKRGLEDAGESEPIRLFISIRQKATIIWMLYLMSPIIPLQKYRELFSIKK